ncbi:MAG: VCBS repeat-containing protein [Balneolales bacterium]|nr:VCBS repeat-containing protein [Balneolales bacterium]
MKTLFSTLYGVAAFAVVFYLLGCSTQGHDDDALWAAKENVLFELLDPDYTGVYFDNELFPSEEFNMYIFRNFYNGGGVAAGDLTGNGLPDLFVTGNMVSNRLFENLGDFKFRDITDEAGLRSDGQWSTGVSLADVNGNGLLDIFVGKSGPDQGENRHNQLFINNGDGTFTDKAKEFGIADIGLTTHGVFFDYDGDGWPDLYLVNNSFYSMESFGDATGADRHIPDPLGASKLYRNIDGKYFEDVTEQANILSSAIGFGLSALPADINRNGLIDLYVANDFFERDYLYINNGDGTFTESLPDYISSISYSSMGTDIADLNNDGWPEIYVTDMRPYNQQRLRSKMTIESHLAYAENAARGFHHKYTRNTLQLNMGDDGFAEIARYSGIYATEWSWATLIADFDNSGYSDVYVANGIYKDLLDQDFIEIMANPERIRQMIRDGGDVIMQLMDGMESYSVRNMAFRNNGDLRFTEITRDWGLDMPGFSSGAAWADLNGDGALDLIVNDVHGKLRIYRNRAMSRYPDRNWLRIDLKGNAPNTLALGAQIQLFAGEKYWYREHMLQRGFQSSVEPGFHVGLGSVNSIDSLVVRWPDGRTSRLNDVNLPARIVLDQSEAEARSSPKPPAPSFPGDYRSEVSTSSKKTVYPDEFMNQFLREKAHRKFAYNDFNREQLIFKMRSTEGAPVCAGNTTNSGYDSFFLGGARGQAGTLFFPDRTGGFTSITEPFSAHASSEDIHCHFFDANGSGLDDLYVVSGGNSHAASSSALADRLYINQGDGRFVHSGQTLPGSRQFESGSIVATADLTGNGFADLFVGTRLRPFRYGMDVRHYILENDGSGGFADITEETAPFLLESGMITDAKWADLTANGRPELITVGEWNSIRVYAISDAGLTEITGELGLANTYGLWSSLEIADITGNGKPDIIAGNHGLNSVFRASEAYPLRMAVADLDGNGLADHLIAMPDESGVYFPLVLRSEFMQDVPSFREKYPDHATFSEATLGELLESAAQSHHLREVFMLESRIFLNDGETFSRSVPLPARSQLAPVYTLLAHDFLGTGKNQVLVAGNLLDVKPQTGRYDAMRPHLIFWDTDSGSLASVPLGGKHNPGEDEYRSAVLVKTPEGESVLLSRFNGAPTFYKISR